MPKEHRDFALKRRAKPLTSEKLMRILNQTEGGERAKQVYKYLTGLNPPPDEQIQKMQDLASGRSRKGF